MPEKQKGFTESFKETVETIKMKAQSENIMKRGGDLIVYLILLIGLGLSFFQLDWGSILVGAALGWTFASEFSGFFRGLKGRIDREGLSRPIVLFGTILFFLIAFPLGVIATLIAMLIGSFAPRE